MALSGNSKTRLNNFLIAAFVQEEKETKETEETKEKKSKADIIMQSLVGKCEYFPQGLRLFLKRLQNEIATVMGETIQMSYEALKKTDNNPSPEEKKLQRIEIARTCTDKITELQNFVTLDDYTINELIYLGNDGRLYPSEIINTVSISSFSRQKLTSRPVPAFYYFLTVLKTDIHLVIIQRLENIAEQAMRDEQLSAPRTTHKTCLFYHSDEQADQQNNSAKRGEHRYNCW